MMPIRSLFLTLFLLPALACGKGDDGFAPVDSGALAPRGGTRLKAMLAEASDGIAVLLGWWDSKLGTHCRFVEAGNALRCMPIAGPTIIRSGMVDQSVLHEWFSDAACKEPAVPRTDSTQEGQLGNFFDAGCWRVTGYFQLGQPLPAGTGFRKSGDSCTPISDELSPTLLRVAPAVLEEFVEGTPVVDTTHGGIVATVSLRGEDGSQQPFGLRDTVGGFDCVPSETIDGVRCTPINTARGDRGLYQDNACSMGAAVSPLTCTPHREIPFVSFHGTQKIAAIHRGGAALSQGFRKEGNRCVAVDAPNNIFSVGVQMPLTVFAAAEITEKRGRSQLTQTIWRAGNAVLPRFDSVTSAKNFAFPCALATTDDDVIRCAPPLQVGARPGFADPACRDPVWQTMVPIFSIEARGERVPIEGAPVAISIPRVLRVLSGGAPYMGPVYGKSANSECVLLPSVPNPKQPYRRGMTDIPPKDLIAMPFVVR